MIVDAGHRMDKVSGYVATEGGSLTDIRCCDFQYLAYSIDDDAEHKRLILVRDFQNNDAGAPADRRWPSAEAHGKIDDGYHRAAEVDHPLDGFAGRWNAREQGVLDDFSYTQAVHGISFPSEFERQVLLG